MWTFKFSIKGHSSVFLRPAIYFSALQPSKFALLAVFFVDTKILLAFQNWSEKNPYFTNSLLFAIPLKASTLVQGGLAASSAHCGHYLEVVWSHFLCYTFFSAACVGHWCWTLPVSVAILPNNMDQLKIKGKNPQIFKKLLVIFPKLLYPSLALLEGISHCSRLFPSRTRQFPL